MTKIKDLPKHKRPREKLSEKGAENVSDAELLAILIRTGRSGESALDIAREILKKHPLSKLLAITKDELTSIKGLEDTKAITIKAALELGSRAAGSFNDSLPILDSVKATVAQLADLRGKQKEYFKALHLNARKQLIHKETVSIGTLTQTLVHPHSFTEFLLYTTPNGKVKVEIYLRDENLWLTQEKIADLFGVQRPAIRKHLKNIFESGELHENSVSSILEHTAGDGKQYLPKHYNLDAIIAVCYRVNSICATR